MKLFFLIIFFLNGCSSMDSKISYPKSDHYNGETFFNPWGANNAKTIWEAFKWKMTTKPALWPLEITNTIKPIFVQNGETSSLHITYIGHATTYIQDSKLSILTDPQFSDRASPVSFAGPKRIRKPAIEIENIPALDFVLISHNHYDHLDLPTLSALNTKFHPTFIVPLGNSELLKSVGIEKVVELDWWQKHENIELVPVQHWSARGIRDRNKSLWGGYVITIDNQKVFFAGDTGYGPHFKMIREHCGPMDLSILPIGAYAPRWFMKDQHMNPEDAIMAHADLNSKKSFAIHFETFQLTDEPFEEPRNILSDEMKKKKILPDDFFIPQVGETLLVSP